MPGYGRDESSLYGVSGRSLLIGTCAVHYFNEGWNWNSWKKFVYVWVRVLLSSLPNRNFSSGLLKIQKASFLRETFSFLQAIELWLLFSLITKLVNFNSLNFINIIGR